MKKYFSLFFLSFFLSSQAALAQCATDEVEVSVSFSCPSGDCYISVYASNPDYSVYYLTENYVNFENESASFCIPSDGCVMFSIYDNINSGMLDLAYTITVDGQMEVLQTGFEYNATHYINCPEGAMCQTPIEMTGDGTYTTTADDTWYVYTPPVTGLYSVSTCGNNSCDTKIWVYETCPWTLYEGPPGTYAFNDDADCGAQAATDLSLEAGNTYLIRVGDSYDDCSEEITFTFAYLGPIVGCMDQTACNYNPLAQEAGDCIYYPDPQCSLPDLQMNVETLLSSIYITQVQSSSCDVVEGIVTGDGTRTVMTFSVRIDNIGNADYYIGNPSQNPEMFEIVNCHGHTHYAGYGDYRLMDMQGNIIPAGHKNGFCVMDLCGFGQYNCGQMGISVGCYDQYGAGTPGQWFDITDVPDGTYRGLVTVNPLHLPDALGHNESDYENNTYVFCFDLTTTGSGRAFTLLGECPPYYDCLGVENGTAQEDCNGECNGPSIWGDVQSDSDLNSNDLSEYLNILEQETIVVTTCNDLSANGALTVYDLALANVCIGESEVGGTSACDFPHDLITSNGACGMAITNVNFDESYIDVELKTTVYDIVAYQFTIDGITISSVESLMDPASFACATGFNPYTNSIFCLGNYLEKIDHSNNAQQVMRIHYSQIQSNTLCITGITDIVTSQRSRTANYIYGDCFDATAFSTNEIFVEAEIRLMPNPVNGQVMISFDRFTSSPKSLVVRNNVGSIVRVIPVTNGSKSIQEDFSNLAAGMYTICSEEKNNPSVVTRFVKL